MQVQSPDLSAQDVNLLHQIVLRAQEQANYHEQPSKTLFEAYDAIFAENGLDTHNDRACLRVLLQLGRPNVAGESLYEKFEHLLEQAGIVLRFEEDATSVAGTSITDPQEYTVPGAELRNTPLKPDRRNSFTSIHDLTADQRRHHLPRRQSWGSGPPMFRRAGALSPQKPHLPIPHRQLQPEDGFTGRLDNTLPRTDIDSLQRFLAASQHDQTPLRPSGLGQPLSRPVEYFAASDHPAEIMDVALQKDRMALLRQAFSNWQFGAQVKRQERRLQKIEAALEQQHAHVTQRADETYRQCLLAKAFCHWMFMAMTAKAKTDAARVWLLRHKYLMAWQRFTVKLEMQTERPLKQKVFHMWLSKSERHLAQHQSISSRIHRMSDWRIARTFFENWQNRSHALRTADSVRAECVKVSAFEKWRLRYRSVMCLEQASQQLQRQKLKAWLISARCSTFIRDRNRQLLKRTLWMLVDRNREQQSFVAGRVKEFQAGANSRLLRSSWQSWKAHAEYMQEGKRKALDYYNAKIGRNALHAWRDCLKHNQRQDLRANDAHYYFLTTKFLNTWKSVSDRSQKSRRNELYKRLRIKAKQEICRRAFGTWRSRLDNLSDMQYQSLARCDGKSRAMVQSFFVKWQIRTSQLRQSSEQASSHYETVLLKRILTVVVDTPSVMKSYQSRAEAFYSIRVSEVCRSSLRRLSQKAFETKRRREDANAMRERHFAKHVRGALRHWHGKSKDITLMPQKLSPMSMEAGREPTDAGYGTGTGTATAPQSFTEHPVDNGYATAFGVTQQNEEWTTFDHDLLEINQMPGYLNTPSKRAARVKALVNASTTPATPWTAQLGRSRFGPPSKRAHLFRDLG